MKTECYMFCLHYYTQATAGEVFPLCSYLSPEHQILFQRSLREKL